MLLLQSLFLALLVLYCNLLGSLAEQAVVRAICSSVHINRQVLVCIGLENRSVAPKPEQWNKDELHDSQVVHPIRVVQKRRLGPCAVFDRFRTNQA